MSEKYKYITGVLSFLLMVALILLAASMIANAVNTQSDFKTVSGVRSKMVLDTPNAAGANCLNVDGYTYKSIGITITGTANADIEISNDNLVSIYDTQPGITATGLFERTLAATHFCIRLNTCTGCIVTASIMAQDERKEAQR